jgi:opacity protein-like surface antigen
MGGGKMKRFNNIRSLLLILGLVMLLLVVDVLGIRRAQAETEELKQDWYLGVSIGPLWRESVTDEAGTAEFETGFSFSGFLGYRIKSFRIEGEYTYLDNDLKTLEPQPRWGIPKQDPAYGHVDANALFLNGYYDLPLGSKFKLYLGGGLGSRNVSIHGLSSEFLRNIPLDPPDSPGPIMDTADSEWTFAYQLKVGGGVMLNQRTEFFLGYRYLSGEDLVFYMPSGTRITPHAKWHNVELGLRIGF